MAPNWPPIDPNSPGLGPKWRPLGYTMIILGILGIIAVIVYVIVLAVTGTPAPQLGPNYGPAVSGSPVFPPPKLPGPGSGSAGSGSGPAGSGSAPAPGPGSGSGSGPG